GAPTWTEGPAGRADRPWARMGVGCPLEPERSWAAHDRREAAMPRPEVTRVLIVALVTTSLAFSCARAPSPTPSPSSPLTPVETPSATEPTPTVTTPAPTVTTPAPTVTTPATSKPATSKPATTKPATTPTVVPTVPASLRGQD